MPNVSQLVGPLVGGVSQAPSHLRASEYATELVNALAHPSMGITKRPGTRHRAKLANSSDSHYPVASLFPFNAGDKRRYMLSVSSGVLRVVETDTGTERTVIMKPGAVDYISGTLADKRPFEAATTGDTLYLTNRSRVVAKGTTQAPVKLPAALVAVRSGDFDTQYTVRLDGVDTSYTTPAATSATVRSAISTDTIAANLALAISGAPGRGAFVITRSGSTLHIRRSDNGSFTISTSDGLSDSGLMLVNETVKSAIDLPVSGVVDGFTVRVGGDATTGGDDYWMGWFGGVWSECPKPGSLVSLDASTMPHALQLGGALHDGLTVPSYPSSGASDGGAPAISSLVWDSPANPTDYVLTGGSLKLKQTQHAIAPATPAFGLTGTVIVTFSLDTVRLFSGWEATVTLERVDSGGTAHPLDSLVYPSTGDVQGGLVITGTDTFSAGDKVRLTLTMANGGSGPPSTSANQVFVTVDPTGVGYGDSAGVIYIDSAATHVAFPPTALYPGGAVLTVVADAVTVNHTVPDTGETGSQVATAFATAWPAGAVTCTDAGGGTITLRKTGGGLAPTVTTTMTFDAAHVMWLADGSYTPAALVGLPVENITTGAIGTVTANTAHSITVSALSGGSATTLRSGDVVRISAAPDSFTFGPVDWETRSVGDDVTNPFPSFVGRTIDNLGVRQNRLVMSASENVIASGSAKFSRFFRSSTQQVLDNDVIDVRGIATRGLPFWHMVDWSGTIHLLNARGLYSLDGDPLTPRTVGLGQVFAFDPDEQCRPAVVGRRLYVARVKDGRTQLLSLEESGAGVGVDSYDTTTEVPEYVTGSPLLVVADSDSPVVVVTTTGIFAMQPVTVGRGVAFAWAQWALDPGASILAASMSEGDLVLVIARSDGVYLESIDTLAHLT